MSQSKSDHAANAQRSTDAKWKPLYRTGALAPLIALLFYLIEFSILILGEPYPANIGDWYELVQRSKVLALWYLNALDIVSLTLLGIMFLALYVALRRIHPSWTLIALYLALLGAAVFVVPRVLHLSLLPLSDLHAAATTEAQRTLYLAAGEALSQVSSATPQTFGFLLMAAAGMIMSFVVLRSDAPGRPFGQAAAYIGIVGFVATLANFVSRLLAPDVAAVVMPVNGLLWFAWWVMVSIGLFRLARHASG